MAEEAEAKSRLNFIGRWATQAKTAASRKVDAGVPMILSLCLLMLGYVAFQENRAKNAWADLWVMSQAEVKELQANQTVTIDGSSIYCSVVENQDGHFLCWRHGE
jgi:hypothetical protein